MSADALHESNKLERTERIEILWQEIESEEQKALAEFGKTAVVPGFQVGKVRPSILRQRYGQAIREKALEELMREKFHALIETKKLAVAGLLSFDPEALTEGQSFFYKATFELFPDIQLKDLAGSKVTQVKASITDADIEQTLDELRKRSATYEIVERKAQNDDQVVIDFEGSMDGKLMDRGTAKGFELVLGSHQFIPGFEEALIGAKAGDERVIDLVFPENYHEKTIAGKPVQFKVNIHQVQALSLPPLDDEFAKGFVKEGGVEAMLKEFRTSMERELSKALRAKHKEAVFDALLAANPVEVPKSTVAMEIQRLRDNMRRDLQRYMPKQQAYPDHMLPADMFMANAKRHVALGLLLAEVVKKHDIKADGKKVQELINERAAAYDNPEEVTRYYYSNEKMLEEFEQLAVEEQVVDKLLENADIEETTVGYFEIMGKNAAGAHYDDHDHDDHEHVHDEHCQHDH